MPTVRNLRLGVAVLIVLSAVAVNVASRLWRFPADNGFLIILISGPFVLFVAPAFLAKRLFAFYFIGALVVVAACFGIVAYYGPAYGPEIPTMYFAVPLMQTVLALVALTVAAIDFSVWSRRQRQIA